VLQLDDACNGNCFHHDQGVNHTITNLQEYNIIETANEATFDKLACKVQAKFDASLAFVSLVDLK